MIPEHRWGLTVGCFAAPVVMPVCFGIGGTLTLMISGPGPFSVADVAGMAGGWSLAGVCFWTPLGCVMPVLHVCDVADAPIRATLWVASVVAAALSGVAVAMWFDSML